MLSDTTGFFVIKPCVTQEVQFYESIPANNPELLHHVPTFFGTLALSSPEEQKALEQQDPLSISAALQAQTADNLPRPPVSQQQRPIDTEQAIVLENIAHGFTKPNVLDIKLGARLWDDETPPLKRARLDKVAAETTTGSLGFRIAGMRVWQKPQRADDAWGCTVHLKDYGRMFTSDNVVEGFQHFFSDSSKPGRALSSERLNMVERCNALIAGIETALERQESRMFSSSILIVYEADEAALSNAIQREEEEYRLYQEKMKSAMHRSEDEHEDSDGETDEDGDGEASSKVAICNVKLIDFGHAAWTPGAGPDENTLAGIRSVRSILQDLMHQPDRENGTNKP